MGHQSTVVKFTFFPSKFSFLFLSVKFARANQGLLFKSKDYHEGRNQDFSQIFRTKRITSFSRFSAMFFVPAFTVSYFARCAKTILSPGPFFCLPLYIIKFSKKTNWEYQLSVYTKWIMKRSAVKNINKIKHFINIVRLIWK